MDFVFEPREERLRNGRRVGLRLAGPQDEVAYLQAFDRLSPEARYMRFMRVVREPNREALRRMLASFPERGFALVAVDSVARQAAIVGSALCMSAREAKSGEFAMTVASEYGRAGLGRLLLSTLIELARQRGLGEITGYVLAANQPMLRLARRMGFVIAPDPDDSSARVCRLRLIAKSGTDPDS